MQVSLGVVGLLLYATHAIAAERATTHGELDAQIDGLARQADLTLGARLRELGAPPSVVANLVRIVETTRPRLHAVPPRRSAGRADQRAVAGFGAALELTDDALTGSWVDGREGQWHGEQTLLVGVGGAVVQRTKGDGVIRQRTLTRVDRSFRLGIVTVPAGTLSVKVTRREDSPLGPGHGRELGSTGLWIFPDGSRQSMKGPFTTPMPGRGASAATRARR